MSDLIINQPGLQKLRQRFASSLLTFLFWVIWIYLWLPLFSLFAWLLGVDLFYDQMIVRSGYEALVDVIAWYLLVILLIAITLLVWAGYNLFRFRNKNRRRGSSQVTLSEIADHFGTDAGHLAQWHSARYMIIHSDQHGEIQHVETSSGTG
jgi:biofilm PGA synthesis protein PgaD